LRQAAERDLQYARANYTAERRSLLNLEQIARESMNKNNTLEKANAENVKRIAALEEVHANLAADKIELERDLIALSQKLEESLEQQKLEASSLETEKAKRRELELELNDKAAFIETLHNQMQILEEKAKLAEVTENNKQ
jgi:hypothetical protein